MNGAKKVLLATYGLDRQFSGTRSFRRWQNLLVAAKDRDVVLDLRTFDQVCREADKPLEMLWGAECASDVAIECKIEALKTQFDAGTKVLELGLTDSQIATVKAAGFVTIAVVNTLSELLAAKGFCVANFDNLVKSASKTEILRIIDLKKSAGEAIHSFNIVETVESGVADP